MAVLVPLAALVLAALAFEKRGVERRRAIVYAGLCGSAFAAISAEILSVQEALTFGSVLGAWVLALLAAAFAFARVAARPKGAPAEPLGAFWRTQVAASALLLLVIALVALVSPPNEDDSLTYHMPRVMHWLQDQSLAHYPTHVLRQLHMPPLAEIEILHLQLLAGGDRFANFVQWGHLAGLGIACSLIAEDLGAGAKEQVLAAVFALTIPPALLEASSARNDLVLAFQLACLADAAVVVLDARALDWRAVIAGGTSLGLMLDTKGVTYAFAAPFAAGIAAILAIRHRASALKPLAAFTGLSIIFPIGQYLRNLATYGNILGPLAEGDASELKSANAVFGLSTLISNSVRNFAACLGAPGLPHAGLTRFFAGLLRGIGIDPDDPATTWGFASRFAVPDRPFHESFAPSAFHLLLVALAVPLIVSRQRVRIYAGAIVLAFALYAGVFRYQLWAGRLLLPLVALWGPVVASAAFRLPALAARAVSSILILGSVPWAVYCEARPLPDILETPRDRLYVNDYPERLREAYFALTTELERLHVTKIGLMFDFETAEYPIWALLHHPAHIEHVGVENVSKRWATPFSPEAIVLIDWEGKNALVESEALHLAGRYPPFVLYTYTPLPHP